MAQQQQNIFVAAPGFAGLNTQDSPVGMDITYASIADNCVIDNLGRIAARKGFNAFTENPFAAGVDTVPIVSSFIFQDDTGTEHILGAGNNKIYRQLPDGQLVELTLPVGYPTPITDDDWQFVQLQDVCYMVQAQQAPLKYDDVATPGTYVLSEWAELPTALPTVPDDIGYPNAITAGFGRIFCGDFDANKSYWTWSNLLDGDSYTDYDAGNFDLSLFWPRGYDEIVSIRVHNSFMIIWGKESILLYAIPDSGPVDAILQDTIEGIGCAARDSVQPTGSDVYFLDYTGVRLLSRTIQEKSIPLGDVSINVRDDIQKLIVNTDNRNIRAVYDPDNSFYAVFFPESTGNLSETYVFDTRVSLENGGQRPTRWPSTAIFSATRSIDDTTWYTGVGGFYRYTGYNDVTKTSDTVGAREVASYPLAYYTHPQTWDQPVNLKFPKQVDLTVIGGQQFNLCLSWYFDYELTPSSFCRFIDRGRIWEYSADDSQYGLDSEYSGASDAISTEQFNVWGNGRNIKFGFDTDISGTQLSFQELNIQALFGRII